MEHRARLERLLIGLRGLGLLRRWPIGDSVEADEQLRLMADMLQHRGEPPMSETLLLEEFDHVDGYAAWAETYDDPGNALIDSEGVALRPILGRCASRRCRRCRLRDRAVDGHVVRVGSSGDGD